MITSRNYDSLPGGKDHFAADRAQAARLLAIYRPLAAMARENRAFLARAVTWAARQGITQFLDLGAGLPAAPSTHQVAQAADPGAAVAYVDLDPVVLSHAWALLATSDKVAAVAADLREPAAVLASPGLRTVIDPAAPVDVILGAVLHCLDADAARQLTSAYTRLMAPGSCLIISVARFDDEALGKQLAAEYTAGTFVNHAPDDIASFLAGLNMTGPGLAEARTWRAWMPGPVSCRRIGHVLAAVARIPS